MDLTNAAILMYLINHELLLPDINDVCGETFGEACFSGISAPTTAVLKQVLPDMSFEEHRADTAGEMQTTAAVEETICSTDVAL